ncbi:MAG: hypothetical protein R3D85_16625 [Paracoccaceae bacterium]
MVHDGETVFEADDIVVFHVENANPDGSFNANTVITGVTVYDNASDYYNDIPLYSYSGSADIDLGRNNMGDTYLEFDASGLTSTDPGAPTLDELALFPGVDIFGIMANTTGPFHISTTQDVDLNGDGIITPDEQGDGIFQLISTPWYRSALPAAR